MITQRIEPSQLSRVIIIGTVLSVLTLADCRQRQRPLYIVIPKSQANVFWQAIHAGAAAAAREGSVDIEWNAPAVETDYARQIAIVDDAINRHVDGIEVVPSDRTALVGAIHRARQAGIPVSVIDSGVNSEEYVSFVATDNYQGGVLASKRMAEILGRQGEVAIVAALPGAASAVEREQGFKDKLAKETPQIKIVAFQYGMADRAKSLAVSEDILTAHPGLAGIFASNEPSTIGAVQAVKSRGLAGKVEIVGFDTSPSLVDDLRAHTIDSLVLQDPFRIGYTGLKVLLDKRAGRNPPPRITLPPVLVTSDHAEAPQFQNLLHPEVQLP